MILTVMLSVAVGCGRATSSADATGRAGASTSAEPRLGASAVRADRVAPYPRGRWRLAVPSELEHVVLWASHILVQYAGVDSRRVPLSSELWLQPERVITRSRAEALAQAQALSAKLMDRATPFDQVANLSDDVVRLPFAGFLGGVRASDLTLWPQVLDALAALAPGEVSAVVETEFGFHVFRRHAVPDEQSVAGQRMVIGHRHAQWLNYSHRQGRQYLHRTREEALALADEVGQRLRQSPSTFEAIIAEHSDHADAESQGHVGTWSTREPSYLNPEIIALTSLPVGAISAPVDTPLGVQIIRRIVPAPTPRVIAMARVQLAFDPRVAPGDSSSASATRILARSILRVVQQEPAQFERFQSRYCCSGVEHWREGRGPIPLGPAVEALALDSVVPEPLEVNDSYVIPRRLNPEAFPQPAWSFELPSPATADLDWLVAHATPHGLASLATQLGPEGARALRLQGEQAESVMALHRDFATRVYDVSDGAKRVELMYYMLEEIKKQLGVEVFSEYFAWLQHRIDGHLLGERGRMAKEQVSVPP